MLLKPTGEWNGGVGTGKSTLNVYTKAIGELCRGEGNVGVRVLCLYWEIQTNTTFSISCL